MRGLLGRMLPLALAGLVAAGAGLFAGCNGDDKGDGGPTGDGRFTEACDRYCERMCELGVQCGQALPGECTRERIAACGDDAEALIGTAKCEEALAAPWDCSIFNVPE